MLHERMMKRVKMTGVILWPLAKIKMMRTYEYPQRDNIAHDMEMTMIMTYSHSQEAIMTHGTNNHNNAFPPSVKVGNLTW